MRRMVDDRDTDGKTFFLGHDFAMIKGYNKAVIFVLAVILRHVTGRAESIEPGDIVCVLPVLTLHSVYHIALLEHDRATVLAF